MLKTVPQAEWRPVASSETLQLGVVRGGPGGRGSLIDSPESPGLIAGVQVAPLVIRPDDRGYFEELFR